MYGEIPGWSPAGAYTCRMIRAVAKVQVQLGPSFSDVTGDFNAETIIWYIGHLPDSGYIQPKSAPAGICPDRYNATAAFNFLQKAGATARQTDLYVYEFPNATNGVYPTQNPIDIKKFSANRPYVMLRKGSGINNAPDTRFWRLEFYNHTDGEYLDIIRNHHYIFTINSVRNDGANLLTDAHGFPGSNIEYTVRVDDDSQSVTSNGQFAIVTNVDTVKIPDDVTDAKVATFRHINPTELTNLRPRVDTIIVESGSIQPPGATLKITAPTGTDWYWKPMITDKNQDLKITTENGLEKAVLLIKFGNITHRLPVRKQP
jgi:hypothetical protein